MNPLRKAANYATGKRDSHGYVCGPEGAHPLPSGIFPAQTLGLSDDDFGLV